MKKQLFLLTIILCVITNQNLLGQLQTLRASDGVREGHFGTSIALFENLLFISDSRDRWEPEGEGVYIYEYSGGNWNHTGKIQRGGTNATGRVTKINDHQFLFSVIGEGLFLYEVDGSSFYEVDKLPEDILYNSVSFDDGKLAVGSYSIYTGEGGKASIFNIDPWEIEDEIMPSNSELQDAFGTSIYLKKDLLFIGAQTKGLQNEGAAYIFKNNGTSWAEIQQIKGSEASWNDFFGSSLFYDGEQLFVAAVSQGSGVVYVFEETDNEWREVQILKPRGLSPFSSILFGWEIVKVGDYLFISAPHFSNEHGAVYSFKKITNAWEEAAMLNPLNGAGRFGIEISSNKDFIAVSAFNASFDVGKSEEGAVYIYKVDGVTTSKDIYHEHLVKLDVRHIVANQTLQISLDNLSLAHLELRLIDSNGKYIQTPFKAINFNSNFERTLDISNLPNGVYLLGVYLNGEIKASRKIVKY